MLNYIRNTWIPFKELYIEARTEKYKHFENHVTSRVEGAHAMLKKYLQMAKGNLYGVSIKFALQLRINSKKSRHNWLVKRSEFLVDFIFHYIMNFKQKNKLNFN